MAKAAAESLCDVCGEAPFQYTCPRCEALYCSLKCYKVHASSCVEEFNRDNVLAAMDSEKPTAGEAEEFGRRLADMREALDEMDDDSREPEDDEEEYRGEEDEEGASDAELGEERIEELKRRALDDELQLEDLTAKELKMFESAVRRGIVNQFVEPWKPWWEEVTIRQTDVSTEHLCCKVASEGAARTYDKKVWHTLVDALAAYASISRLHNGDVMPSGGDESAGTAARAACWEFVELAQLDQTAPPKEHLQESTQEFCNRLAASDELKSEESIKRAQFASRCLYDACRILTLKEHCCRALREAEGWMKLSGGPRALKKEQRIAILRTTKKLCFLRSVASFHWEDGEESRALLLPIAATKESQARAVDEETARSKAKKSKFLVTGNSMPR